MARSKNLLLALLGICLLAPAALRAETDDDDDFDDREEAWEDYRDSIEWARRGSFRHALSEVGDALEKLPNQGEFLLQKAFVLLELCYTDEAIAILKSAQAAGPARITREAERELVCMGELDPKDATVLSKDDPTAKAAKPGHPKHYGPEAHDPHLGRWYAPYPGCCEGDSHHH